MRMPLEETFRNIAEISISEMRSEEDVKIKIVLPFLRALGYDDGDFNYEAKTGRGYVDIVVDKFPVGIIVETKSPGTKLEKHVEQLELYVFKKHNHWKLATVAILTDGNIFQIFGITEAFRAGTLARHQILNIHRSNLKDPQIAHKIIELLDADKNKNGAVPDAIELYHQENYEKQKRINAIDEELHALAKERERINAREAELREESARLLGASLLDTSKTRIPSRRGSSSQFSRVSSPHILRLLREQGAVSKETAVQRSWLDDQLVGRIDEIPTQQEVSWGLIELKDKKIIEYEKGRDGIGPVWIQESSSAKPETVEVELS